MEVRIPELNKKTGVHYAVTNSGIELPIIDITHPSFALDVSEADFAAAAKSFEAQTRAVAWMPKAAQAWLTKQFLQRSTLGKGLLKARGSFLDGTTTYLFKVGAANLGKGYSTKIDQDIAKGVPALSMRMRIQDMAQLLVKGLVEALNLRPGVPLHFLDIAGGPAVDCLNAQILLQKSHPELLAGRRIFTHVLDLDSDGPAFGERALAAMQGPSGPLHGLDIRFERIPYNWAKPEELTQIIESLGDGVFACSSEGGLFEYGSDDEIVANLKALRNSKFEVATVVGSVTPATELRRRLSGPSQFAVKPRTIEEFTKLAAKGGWRLVEVRDRPMSHDVQMTPIHTNDTVGSPR